jgi:hypothetical protein
MARKARLVCIEIDLISTRCGLHVTAVTNSMRNSRRIAPDFVAPGFKPGILLLAFALSARTELFADALRDLLVAWSASLAGDGKQTSNVQPRPSYLRIALKYR